MYQRVLALRMQGHALPKAVRQLRSPRLVCNLAGLPNALNPMWRSWKIYAMENLYTGPHCVCDLAGLPKSPEPVKRAPEKEGGKEGEEKPPPLPDTRSWLQKNWIFAVPVVMIVRPAPGTRKGLSYSAFVHRSLCGKV